MRSAAALALALGLAAPAAAQDLAEPATGVRFPLASDGHRLLGVGLRVKKVAFVKVKVYVVALYVSEAALAGPLAAYRGRPASPELYRELAWGDFDKRLTLRFVRDLDREQIQKAMREALAGQADPALLERFVSYFPELKQGQQAELRWLPGGALAATMAGQPRTPIESKDFAAAVFGLFLGERPLQDDIKLGLVSRLASPSGTP
jgi:hypothetical protein